MPSGDYRSSGPHGKAALYEERRHRGNPSLKAAEKAVADVKAEGDLASELAWAPVNDRGAVEDPATGRFLDVQADPDAPFTAKEAAANAATFGDDVSFRDPKEVGQALVDIYDRLGGRAFEAALMSFADAGIPSMDTIIQAYMTPTDPTPAPADPAIRRGKMLDAVRQVAGLGGTEAPADPTQYELSEPETPSTYGRFIHALKGLGRAVTPNLQAKVEEVARGTRDPIDVLSPPLKPMGDKLKQRKADEKVVPGTGPRK